MYLFHYPIYGAVVAYLPLWLGPTRWMQSATALALTIACALMTWRMIERPILGFKRYFPYEVPDATDDHSANRRGGGTSR